MMFFKIPGFARRRDIHLAVGCVDLLKESRRAQRDCLKAAGSEGPRVSADFGCDQFGVGPCFGGRTTDVISELAVAPTKSSRLLGKGDRRVALRLEESMCHLEEDLLAHFEAPLGRGHAREHIRALAADVFNESTDACLVGSPIAFGGLAELILREQIGANRGDVSRRYWRVDLADAVPVPADRATASETMIAVKLDQDAEHVRGIPSGHLVPISHAEEMMTAWAVGRDPVARPCIPAFWPATRAVRRAERVVGVVEGREAVARAEVER